MDLVFAIIYFSFMSPCKVVISHPADTPTSQPYLLSIKSIISHFLLVNGSDKLVSSGGGAVNYCPLRKWINEECVWSLIFTYHSCFVFVSCKPPPTTYLPPPLKYLGKLKQPFSKNFRALTRKLTAYIGSALNGQYREVMNLAPWLLQKVELSEAQNKHMVTVLANTNTSTHFNTWSIQNYCW